MAWCLSVAPSFQQHSLLPEIAAANEKRVFVILLVRPDPTKMPEQLRTRCTSVHLRPLGAMDVRRKILTVCKQERIGYHREALEEIVKRSVNKLAPSLALLHQVFLNQHFVSLANINKTVQLPQTIERKASLKAIAATPIAPTAPLKPGAPNTSTVAAPPFPLSIIDLSTPLRRCPKCTLMPPCSHVSLTMLHERVDRIRKLYPNADSVSTATELAICPTFRKHGVCGNIKAIGRCRYAHPLDLHVIDTHMIVERCAKHTLPLPCLHCNSLREMAALVKTESGALKSLAQELQQAKKCVVDLENERFMLMREQSRTVKWGNMKREFNEHVEALDARITSAKETVLALSRDLQDRQEQYDRLRDDVMHGRSKGVGKGRGGADAAIVA